MNQFWWWVCLACSSTGFSGFLPGKLLGKPGKGGGTAGSAVTLLFLLSFMSMSASMMIFLIVVSFIIGMVVVGPAEQFMLAKWGPRTRHTGEEVTGDFNETNIDEVHGMLIAALPIYFMSLSTVAHALFLIFAFIMFRIFDAGKMWPINAIEENVGVKGGALNVMVDDTVAGLVAAVPVVIALLAADLLF